MIEEALYYHLANDAVETVALVGTRVFPIGEVPRNVSPSDRYITYQRIDNPEHRHQTGTSGLFEARFQLNCIAETHADAAAMARALRSDLNQYRDEMGEAGNKTTVRGMFYEGERDSFEKPNDASARGPQMIPVDFIIWFVE